MVASAGSPRRAAVPPSGAGEALSPGTLRDHSEYRRLGRLGGAVASALQPVEIHMNTATASDFYLVFHTLQSKSAIHAIGRSKRV